MFACLNKGHQLLSLSDFFVWCAACTSCSHRAKALLNCSEDVALAATGAPLLVCPLRASLLGSNPPAPPLLPKLKPELCKI